MDTKTGIQNTLIGLGIIVLAFVIFVVIFGLRDGYEGLQSLFVSETQREEEIRRAQEQNILASGLVNGDQPEIVDVVPDPDPVPENQRVYPAQRILELQNLIPLSIEEATDDFLEQQAIERKREEEERIRQALLAAHNIEDSEPDGKYVLDNLERLGSINARSFLVGDLDTGEVIFERQGSDQYAIASITKIMTAFTAARTLQPNEVATITRDKLTVEGNRGGFLLNDQLTILELIYPLLLVSSNDAAEIIAQQRSRPTFIESMNAIASEFDLFSTRFEDPSGLSANNVSTAQDLFKLMRVTMLEMPQIVGISQLSRHTLDDYTWYNINRASSFPEFRGGKTGFTNAALQTSVGYYEITLGNGEKKNVGVVILQSSTRQQDTRNILDYLKNFVSYEQKTQEDLVEEIRKELDL